MRTEYLTNINLLTILSKPEAQIKPPKVQSVGKDGGKVYRLEEGRGGTNRGHLVKCTSPNPAARSKMPERTARPLLKQSYI